MTMPTRVHEDDPPPPAEEPPNAIVWMIAGCALVLAYVAVLALLRPAV